MRRHLPPVCVLAAAHLLLLGIAFLVVIATFSGEGTQDPRTRRVGDVAGRVGLALAQPAAAVDEVLGLGQRYGDVVGLALVPLNSLLWGAGLYGGWRTLRRPT